jgi:DNA-binding MarR family transcriptional regulator
MKVLISHIQDEYPLAETLKQWLEDSFIGQFDVDLNNDIEVMKSGNAWLKEIDPLYTMNTLLIVLCSPDVITRKWADFKPGKLDGNRIPLLLICHSGLGKDRLPPQLSECDALDTDEDGFEGKFVAMIAAKTHLPDVPTIDEMAFMDAVAKSLRNIEARRLLSSQQPLPEALMPEALLKVLTKLAQSAGGTLTAGQLAERTNMPEAQVNEALAGLLQRNLITRAEAFQRPDSYTISNQARNFIQQVTLL